MTAKQSSAEELLAADEFMTLLEPDTGGRMELVAAVDALTSAGPGFEVDGLRIELTSLFAE